MKHQVTSRITNMSRDPKIFLLLCMASLVFLAVTLTARADAGTSDSDWQFSAELYL